MRPGQERFIEDLGTHMVGWGLPRTTGRVWAYLLLCTEPAGLDEITDELSVAKSGVSIATRQLVRSGLARSAVQRGSKRLVYSALHTPEAIFAARSAQAVELIERLRDGARVAPSPLTSELLDQMATGIERLIQELSRQLVRIREEAR